MTGGGVHLSLHHHPISLGRDAGAGGSPGRLVVQEVRWGGAGRSVEVEVILILKLLELFLSQAALIFAFLIELFHNL